MTDNPKAFAVSHRSVFAIAIPSTLAYLSVPLLGFVDTGVVGQLGDPALLGGLAIGAIFFDIVYTSFNFLRSSTTGLVAQALGAGQQEEQRIILMRSLILSCLLGAITLLFSPLILSFGLWLVTTSSAVETAVSDYFSIRVLSAPFALINFSILGWLLGLGQAGRGLILQSLLNGSNIVLSFGLGLSMGWGIDGVAWATVIAEIITAVVGLIWAWRRLRGGGAIQWPVVFETTALVRLFAVNRDILIRSFTLFFAFAFFTAQGSQFGDVTLAANAILMNFFLFAGYFLDGFAAAAEQLAGRAVGARDRIAFDRSVRLTLIWGFALALFTSLLFLVFGPWIIDLLSSNEAIRNEARVYLMWAALTALAGVMAFQMDGVFIGATWSQDMRNMMLLSLAVYFLTWFIATPLFGNHGLWLALEVFLGMRGLSLYWRLRIRRQAVF